MEQQMNNFVGLSAVLTGFAADTIAPNIDPINIKAEYFTKFTAEISNYAAILSAYELLKSQGKTDQEIGEAILAIADYEMPCRQLIFLWYSGAWATANGSMTSSEMLSAKSYTQGLAWQVMQSHPMGDSNYRYGYWANEPADLSGYTGNNN
tara:strand:+ start:7440 stop:7892 length:453 start_codon:yes stop_codon:yes gene_type:complete